jgi:Domain of unknown function (DUF4159)/Aerotolerance regulator N-terminal
MPGLSSLLFANPLLLAALGGLPVLWWWLRALPPKPQRIVFPALALIAPAKAIVAQSRPPLWLVLLRIALIALLILAASGPSWQPKQILNASKDLVIIVDNGWQGAASMRAVPEIIATAVQAANAAGGQVAIVGTAQPENGWPQISRLAWMSADLAKQGVKELTPQPWATDRAAFMKVYGPAIAAQNPRMLWISDGIDPGSAAAMSGLGKLEATTLSETGPLAFRNVVSNTDGFRVDVVAVARSRSRQIQVIARQSAGAIAGTATAILPPGDTHVEISVPVAPADRIKVFRLEIAGQQAAAAVYALDDRASRPVVGLYAGENSEQRQPFRAAGFYVKRALETHADVHEGSLDALLKRPVNVLVMADVGALPVITQTALSKWIETGGVLLSFAGPRLAESSTPFAPIPLRPATRTMGGALSWGTPSRFGSFPATSPLSDIAIDENVTVSRQVLAEPSAELASRTWARLTDGTPIITAARRGAGFSVLVHTTAGPDWTDLPLSGMFEQILRRIITLSSASATSGTAITGPMVLETALMGDGTFAAPRTISRAVPAKTFDILASGPSHPPGLYRSGSRVRALNLANPKGPIVPTFNFEPIRSWPAGIQPYNNTRSVWPLAPLLWRLALAFLVADAIATLFVRRRLPRFRLPLSQAIAGAAIATCFFGTQKTEAAPPPAALTVQLAYVSGPSAASADSAAGLAALGDALSMRTAIRPTQPVAVLPGRDPLGLYTIIYWPVAANAEPLDGKAADAIARYIEVGGMLILDTANAGTSPVSRAQSARRLMSSISLPRLEQLTDKHVLAKSFYLLARGPARQLMTQVWVDSDTGGGDGRVSSVIIGNQNLARSWTDSTPDSPNHEAAIRLGINAVMYALTGTYKADQVHAESLLDRLQEDSIKVRRIQP